MSQALLTHEKVEKYLITNEVTTNFSTFPCTPISCVPVPCSTALSRMNQQQLRTLIVRGHHIGSHSLTHRALLTLNETELVDELASSKEMLEAITRSAINTLAFPYGQFDTKTTELLRQLGYTGAVTVIPGFNTAAIDPFELRRLNLHQQISFDQFVGFITNDNATYIKQLEFMFMEEINHGRWRTAEIIKDEMAQRDPSNSIVQSGGMMIDIIK